MLDEDNQKLEQSNADTDFENFTMDMAPQERTDALKILGKRQRRVGKIEECPVDISKLFDRQKRFCPSDSADTTMSDFEDRRLQLTEKVGKELNKKLVNSIIEQL